MTRPVGFGLIALFCLLGCSRKELTSKANPTPIALRDDPEYTLGHQAMRGQSDTEKVLDAAIHDILVNPDLKGAREFYGTPKDKRIALAIESPVPWPRGYTPVVKGYEAKYVHTENEHDRNEVRLLGLTIYHLDLSPVSRRRKDPLFDYPLEIGIMNLGGVRNGGAGGGCIVYYEIRNLNGSLTVEYMGELDP